MSRRPEKNIAIRFIDLFAGCGGLSEGFIQAGYTPVAHVEMNEAACYTLKTRMAYHWLKRHKKMSVYASYLKGEISRDDLYAQLPESLLDSVINEKVSADTLPGLFDRIDALAGGHGIDLIVGGPPCQAYSLVGRASDKRHMRGDERNYLFMFYVAFLKHYQPKRFVFENVTGLFSAADENGVKYFDMMKKEFAEAKYTVAYETVEAPSHGVPQARKRVILVGERDCRSLTFPKMHRRKFRFTVREMLGGLPALSQGETAAPFKISVSGKSRKALVTTSVLDESLPVTQHQARPNNANDLEIYRLVVNAWNKSKKRLTYDELPERLRTRTNLKSFTDRYKVVAGNLSASHTVIAHIAKDGHYYIHPSLKQNRSLSVREAARLQTFPDNYYFESGSSHAGRAAPYRQIGNAVPVLLAKKIAKAMKGMWK